MGYLCVFISVYMVQAYFSLLYGFLNEEMRAQYNMGFLRLLLMHFFIYYFFVFVSGGVVYAFRDGSLHARALWDISCPVLSFPIDLQESFVR